MISNFKLLSAYISDLHTGEVSDLTREQLKALIIESGDPYDPVIVSNNIIIAITYLNNFNIIIILLKCVGIPIFQSNK